MRINKTTNKMSTQKIGNIVWYFGHILSALSIIPSILSLNIIYGFVISAIGQLITMMSRVIERWHSQPSNKTSVKIGNVIWYIGHSLSILSSVPAITNNKDAVIYGFIIISICQLIVMISRYIERWSKNPPTSQHKLIGNYLWYTGHIITTLSSLPALVANNHIALVFDFVLVALGQVITMVSRMIERWG